jgi:hypothetical protein
MQAASGGSYNIEDAIVAEAIARRPHAADLVADRR